MSSCTLVLTLQSLAGGEALLLGDPPNFLIEPRVTLLCLWVSTSSEGGQVLEVSPACDWQLMATSQ